MKNKFLLGFGTLASALTPVVAVVACSSSDDKGGFTKLSDEKVTAVATHLGYTTTEVDSVSYQDEYKQTVAGMEVAYKAFKIVFKDAANALTFAKTLGTINYGSIGTEVLVYGNDTEAKFVISAAGITQPAIAANANVVGLITAAATEAAKNEGTTEEIGGDLASEYAKFTDVTSTLANKATFKTEAENHLDGSSLVDAKLTALGYNAPTLVADVTADYSVKEEWVDATHEYLLVTVQLSKGGNQNSATKDFKISPPTTTTPATNSTISLSTLIEEHAFTGANLLGDIAAQEVATALFNVKDTVVEGDLLVVPTSGSTRKTTLTTANVTAIKAANDIGDVLSVLTALAFIAV